MKTLLVLFWFFTALGLVVSIVSIALGVADVGCDHRLGIRLAIIGLGIAGVMNNANNIRQRVESERARTVRR